MELACQIFTTRWSMTDGSLSLVNAHINYTDRWFMLVSYTQLAVLKLHRSPTKKCIFMLIKRRIR
ncbi:MAG: hypothetical protein ACYC2P_10970 [Paludibacteraceae bacterium]